MMKRKVQSEKRKTKVKSFKFLILSFSLAFCALSFAFIIGCQNRHLYKDTQVMMGTFIEVISPDKRAANIAFAEIKRMEDLLSKYKPDSEVSWLNRLGKLTVSPETFYVLKKAKEFWQISDGVFDITVEPLVRLWGFRDKNYVFPDGKKIKEALALIGSDKIILQDDNNVVEFKTPGMKIDLGGVAKGFALDCTIKRLKENKIDSCLINAGGQIACLGGKFGRPWRVAVRDPRARKVIDYLELKDVSVATSGDYEQFFLKDNKRYSHILDPKTGLPADSGVICVTVIAPDGLTADALATAIFVLGRERGELLAKKFLGVEVKIIEKTKKGI